MTYDVVLLAEQALTLDDATRVKSLHEGLEGPVYHVLLPREDAAARIEAAMGTLSAAEYVGPAVSINEMDLDEVRKESEKESEAALAETLRVLTAAGATAHGELVDDPVAALRTRVKDVDGREVIILTRPHVVSEFLHLDWTHQARRHLQVPVLHLIEHENFDEQAGEGEGIL
ncbi:MAG: hypothetical protein J2O46_03150 [Nocardioides sp.]|nr:hypothetical protein [Nocardioides sp.]